MCKDSLQELAEFAVDTMTAACHVVDDGGDVRKTIAVSRQLIIGAMDAHQELAGEAVVGYSKADVKRIVSLTFRRLREATVTNHEVLWDCVRSTEPVFMDSLQTVLEKRP